IPGYRTLKQGGLIHRGHASGLPPLDEHPHRRQWWVALASVLVLVAAAAAAWALGRDDPESPPRSPTQTPTQPQIQTSTKLPDDPDVPLAQVKSFYKAYIPAKRTLPAPPISHWGDQGFITQSAVNSVAAVVGEDLVTCSQEPLDFAQYAFSTPGVAGDTATMAVTPVKGASERDLEIEIGLVKTSGVWRIDLFACVFHDAKPGPRDTTSGSVETSRPATRAGSAPDDPAIQSASNFYKAYIAAFKANKHVPPDQWVSQGYLTQSAADSIAAVRWDLATCNKSPLDFSEYSFSRVSSQGVTGVEVTSDEDDARRAISLAQVKIDGTWRINAFACNTIRWR
ncbi:MAG: hypothetical protein LLG14_07900, partial [Nocardiaceae bacterium]|nr:hypothetical protein [Nocardiaceae bacterium]